MNKHLSRFSLLILCSFFSYQAAATLIDTDWNVAGDSKILLDTSTGMRWLDLSVTLDQSYNEVQAQLQAGGTYEGFRYATRDEVLHLWSEASITNTNYVWVDNGEWQIVKNLADRLGTTPLIEPGGIGTHALGMVEGDLSLPADQRRVMEISYHYQGVLVRTSDNFYALDLDFSSIHYSSYLVKTVPVPPSAVLFLSGLFVLLIGKARALSASKRL